jgi:hypothetical protein
MGLWEWISGISVHFLGLKRSGSRMIELQARVSLITTHDQFAKLVNEEALLAGRGVSHGSSRL